MDMETVKQNYKCSQNCSTNSTQPWKSQLDFFFFFFYRSWQTDLNVCMEMQGTQNSEDNFKIEQVGKLTLLDFKT